MVISSEIISIMPIAKTDKNISEEKTQEEREKNRNMFGKIGKNN